MSCLVLVKFAKTKVSEEGAIPIFHSVILTKDEYEAIKDSTPQVSSISVDSSDNLHQMYNRLKYFNDDFVLKLIELSSNELTDKIIELGNPSNKTGQTLAHVIINGQYAFQWNSLFSTENLLKLGNPPDLDGNTLAHSMAERRKYFSTDDIIKLGNPKNDFGETIAHIMVENNHAFSVDEILRLGNPVTEYGQTISNLMQENGVHFSEEDLARLEKVPD